MPERSRGRQSLSPDARRIITVQALRAFVYGLGSVLLGVSLEQGGLSGKDVGVVFFALIAGTALVSVLLARYGDRFGRRRFYRLLLVAMAAAGTVFAFTDWLPALILAALTGCVSVDVVESGPFTSLEQAMLPHAAGDGGITRLFGTYNIVATLAGSLGALAAAATSLFDVQTSRWLLAYPLASGLALAVASRLSDRVEAGIELRAEKRPPLHRSKHIVLELSALFALDSLGGGFVVQAYIAYLFSRKFDASAETLGFVFFAVGILQAISFRAAVHLAERIGLLKTMVFTHLPSNILLMSVAFAPNIEVAIALLLARFALSQMDVPTRQAYVMEVVDPSEQTAAAAYTNTARYIVRPLAPLLAAPLIQVSLGAPFVVAGLLKSIYDVGLYVLFRGVPIDER